MPVPTVDSTTVNDQHSGNSTTLTFNMPDPRPDGKLYLAIGFKDDDVAWTVIPGNWIQITQATQGTNQNLGIWYFFGSSEPATYALTQDNEIGVGVILEIDGADGSNPIHNLAAFGDVPPDAISDHSALDSGTTADPDAPAQTPTVGDTLIIRIVCMDTDDITQTPTLELTKGGDGGSGDVGFGVSSEDGPAADVSAGTANFLSAGAADEWVTATLIIASKIQKTIESFTNLADGDLGKQNSYAGPYVV